MHSLIIMKIIICEVREGSSNFANGNGALPAGGFLAGKQRPSINGRNM